MPLKLNRRGRFIAPIADVSALVAWKRNGPVTHEDECLVREVGESVPADAHHGESCADNLSQCSSARRVAPLSAA
ncbi:MAG: hypothetical protein ACR2H5_09025 [Ktedonobacteraceae bacterium]